MLDYCSAVIPQFYAARLRTSPPQTYNKAFMQEVQKALVRDQPIADVHASF